MDERPNILLIMTEQHRGDALGCAGHPVLLTPNMDEIAGRGVRFSRAYSSCPTCIAARRSLLSGQFPVTHGMRGYQDDMPWEPPTTLPAELSADGYQTCWIGRSIHQHPFRKRFGFQQMIVSGGKNEDNEYHDFLARNQGEGAGGYFGTGVMHNDWTARPWHLSEHLHHTNWVVDQALTWLRRRDPSCPFFLVLSFLAAHPPLLPPACYFERYIRTGVPDPVIGDWAEAPADHGIGHGASASRIDLRGEALLSARAGYYGLINHVDDQLRRVLNPVNGLDRMTGSNTAVFLTSDHGEMLGDHHLWRKSVPYQASAGIPLLCRLPQRFGVDAGQVLDSPVCLEDIMPTMLDLAGLPMPDSVEGRSLLGLMQGRETLDREHLHIEHAPLHQTLTDGREKYIWFVKDGREQFFRLSDDPEERHDLARLPSETENLDRWRQRLIAKLADRPEGFSDGRQLVSGRPYPAVLPT